MSQNTDPRRKAAEVWTRLLLANTPLGPKADSLEERLKNLAHESVKRLGVCYCASNKDESLAWRRYFNATFDKLLSELPPINCSVEELQERTEELGHFTASAHVQRQAAHQAVSRRPRETSNRGLTNKRRRVTDEEDNVENVPRHGTNKRIKTDLEPEAKTAGSTSSMTVYAKGRYTITVAEEGTPTAEITSDVPAAVQVKMAALGAGSETTCKDDVKIKIEKDEDKR